MIQVFSTSLPAVYSFNYENVTYAPLVDPEEDPSTGERWKRLTSQQTVLRLYRAYNAQHFETLANELQQIKEDSSFLVNEIEKFKLPKQTPVPETFELHPQQVA
jgi:hypothetical protein